MMTANQDASRAPDKVADFAIGRTAGGCGGPSPREMETT
jgi:hypothetical protein